MKQNKQEQEHELNVMKLTHQFAMRMATLICWSVVSLVMLLGVFFGAKTYLTLGVMFAIAFVLGIISFAVTRSSCL